MPRGREVVRPNPLCMYQTSCPGSAAMLGPVEPWDDGQGCQRSITCIRRRSCPTSGVQSTNYDVVRLNRLKKAKKQQLVPDTIAIGLVPRKRRS